MVGVTHIGQSGGNRKGWRGQGGRRDFVRTRTGDRREGEQRSQLLSTRERGSQGASLAMGCIFPGQPKHRGDPRDHCCGCHRREEGEVGKAILDTQRAQVRARGCIPGEAVLLSQSLGNGYPC